MKTALILSSLFLSSQAFSATNAGEVSQKLIEAFSETTKKPTLKSSIEKKKYVGLQTETVVFAVGQKVYRIVFSSDGTVSIALKTESDIAAQPIWTTSLKKATVEDIVNFVYTRETGRKYRPGGNRSSEEDEKRDLEAQRLGPPKTERTGVELQWNRLMNNILKGEVTGNAAPGASADSIDQNSNLGKMLDPCAPNRGGASPQRAAITQIAQALTASHSKLDSPQGGHLMKGEQKTVDRSRNFDKKGSYSFLEDLRRYRDQANTDEAIRLLQQNKSDAYELFRTAAKRKDSNEKDPHRLATLRNFKLASQRIGESGAKKLMDDALLYAVVDVDQFITMRQVVAHSPVILDRRERKYYVDPTLNSPTQARYLLSLVVLYESLLRSRPVDDLLDEYERRRGRLEELSNTVLDENDRSLIMKATEDLENLGKELFEFAEELRRAPMYP